VDSLEAGLARVYERADAATPDPELFERMLARLPGSRTVWVVAWTLIARRVLAQRIKQIDADVLALQEVENVEALDRRVDRLEAMGIPCGRVNDLRDVMGHPQLAHTASSPSRLARGPNPRDRKSLLVSGECPPAGAVAHLGEHTDELLSESPSTPDE
jgi:crotonobetainyl-CoA:carnitine CoA-transferase CaiB-like acyl-CoA transferase